VLVPPYDDERIMAGQGTAALELLEDAQVWMPSSPRSAAAG
jgi:threonine dehydratase